MFKVHSGVYKKEKRLAGYCTGEETENAFVGKCAFDVLVPETNVDAHLLHHTTNKIHN